MSLDSTLIGLASLAAVACAVTPAWAQEAEPTGAPNAAEVARELSNNLLKPDLPFDDGIEGQH
jgi:hypothetical protein